MTEQFTTVRPTEKASASKNIDAIAAPIAEDITSIVKRWNKRSAFYDSIELSLSYFTDELAEAVVKILRKKGYDAYFCHDEASIIVYL